MSANYEVFENLKKGDPIMCNALRELMKPEMEEALDNKAKEMAITMIRHNEPDDKIALYTKLTAEQVADLRRKETVTA